MICRQPFWQSPSAQSYLQPPLSLSLSLSTPPTRHFSRTVSLHHFSAHQITHTPHSSVSLSAFAIAPPLPIAASISLPEDVFYSLIRSDSVALGLKYEPIRQSKQATVLLLLNLTIDHEDDRCSQRLFIAFIFSLIKASKNSICLYSLFTLPNCR